MSWDSVTRDQHHDQATADLPAYALGILEPNERERIELHLSDCPACQAALAGFDAVVGDLGLKATPSAPRPQVRANLLSAIHAPGVPPKPRVALLPGFALAVAAVAAILAIALLSLLLARTIDQRDAARHGEMELAEYLSEGGTLSPLLPDPGAADDVQPGHGSLAITPARDQAMLVVHDIPPTDANRTYMAWAEHDGDRIRLGEITVDEHGVGWLLLNPPQPMATYDTVGITRFTASAPEGEPFLLAQVA